MKRIELTNRKGPTLGIFWAGEFGHLIMNVVPRVNAIRKEHPEYRIIIASFHGDHIYFRDDNGDWTIDEYIGFPWWSVDRGCHEVKGRLPKKAELAFNELDSICDEVFHTYYWSFNEYKNEFKAKKQIAYPFKNIIRNIIYEPRDHIVIYARAKNYHKDTRIRSWTTNHWRVFLDMVLKDNNLIAYVCGVKEESIEFSWNERVVPILTGPNRSDITLNLLSNAKYCISDCSGSANYALQVGTPTFISGPAPYLRGFTESKNYFGAYVHYQSADMHNLTPEVRYAGLQHFLNGLNYELQREIYICNG